MTFVFIRGATAWELQIGKLWIAVRYLRFWRTSWPGFICWVEEE